MNQPPFDPWVVTVTRAGPQDDPGPVDWRRLKADVLAGLDVVGEYRALGLRVIGDPDPAAGKVQARAMGREDASPSAFVALKTGLYHAHGDPPETLSFWDFALRYGQFGEWAEMLRHYAGKAGVEVPKFHKNNRGWVEEARYPYHGRGGGLLYEVVRYRQPNGRKTFRQRRPDGSGGWVYNMDGVGRVLYRLPELLEQPDAPVWFTEGELDAESLRELGLVATTSPQGAEAAGRRYWDDGLYAADLAGRDVLIVPDNDPPGRSFAALVATALMSHAAAVKVVTLPELPAKGDVSDWIEAGHGSADLEALAAGTLPFDPAVAAAAGADEARDATAADLMLANAGTRWLWEGWLPLSVLTLLTAEPSTGKTRFCLDLTRRVVNLTQWPDGTPVVIPDGLTNRVLWIAADNQHSELSDAPGRFGFAADMLCLNTTVGDLYGGTELQTADQFADLEARIRRLRPVLVIIDTVTNTTDLKSQDTSDAKRQYKPLQEVAKRTGVAVVCVTHLNVAGKTLGRRADEKTRVTVRLECPDPENQAHRRKLSVALSRLSVRPPALGVTMGDAGNEYDTSPPECPGAPGVHGGPRIAPPAVQEAWGFLSVLLGQGPQRVKTIRDLAEQREPAISAKSLYRARDTFGVEEYELEGRKWWRLMANGVPPDGADNGAPF